MATTTAKKVSDTTKVSKSTKLAKNSKLYKSVISAIENKKGENVLSLDLRKIEVASADFFIVCEASTGVQLKAICDNIEKEVWEQCGEHPYKVEGLNNMEWIIVDYVNIVVHIMLPDIRKYYRLEEMWSDGESV